MFTKDSKCNHMIMLPDQSPNIPSVSRFDLTQFATPGTVAKSEIDQNSTSTGNRISIKYKQMIERTKPEGHQ